MTLHLIKQKIKKDQK